MGRQRRGLQNSNAGKPSQRNKTFWCDNHPCQKAPAAALGNRGLCLLVLAADPLSSAAGQSPSTTRHGGGLHSY
jgi:hypothetical protein